MDESVKKGFFSLAEAKTGHRVRIVLLRANGGLENRLADLGLRRGMEIEVLQNAGDGRIVVTTGDGRVAVGPGMTENVVVSLVGKHRGGAGRRRRWGWLRGRRIGGGAEQRGPAHRNEQANCRKDTGNMQIVLRDMRIGETGRVTGFFKGEPHYRQKLLAMGLTRGAEFTVSRVAPLGDPVEINVRGFSLSLRKHEAAILQVERTGQRVGGA
uniref:Ferrous iron transport protein A n=1 Tax=Candidatus Kentrum sp. FM TaxID=2126340 RepID=A0A450TVW7_9GAMM|nr:MAG: ferrous iron transport protein A [Candidatus Kentron sp. FM]VFJ73153.1 MAG: ferrous iron transport protein A [Candidatus Kentron sp. FM]VFK13856.1 MAG: ferrous iron transport protein A [Candidatus Kentron sp. FM]